MIPPPPPRVDVAAKIITGVERALDRGERRYVLVRLRLDDAGNPTAEPAIPGFKRDRSSVKETLETLAGLVGELFLQAREGFTPDEWALLMGIRAGASDVESLPARFDLLARVLHQRLQVRGFSQFPFKKFRQHGRLIMLPDGMPFSVQLIYSSKRGHSSREKTTPFQSLPVALQLKLIRQCWDTARRDGRTPELVELLTAASKLAGTLVLDPNIELTGKEADRERDRLREKLQSHDREELYEKLRSGKAGRTSEQDDDNHRSRGGRARPAETRHRGVPGRRPRG